MKINLNRLGGFFTWRWFLLVTGITLVLMVASVFGIMAYGEVLELDKIEKYSPTSCMRDKDGREVAKLGRQFCEYVNLEDMKKNNQLLLDAVMLVEDRNFNSHFGIDFKAIGRSVWATLTKRTEGASTITMQVARMLVICDSERTASRKIRELGTALNLERRYTKDKILQAYLNSLPLFLECEGVEIAARVFFNKKLARDRLEPQEVALLAALPKAPDTYSPLSDKTKASSKERRDLILDMMVANKLISKEEAAQAKLKPLLTNKDWKRDLSSLDKADKNIIAYRQRTIQELKEFYGIDLTKSGSPRVEVYTGLDPEVQRTTNDALRVSLGRAPAHNRGGAVILEAKTGLVTAIGGGKEFTLHGSNEAYQVIRPIGSAIKPLTVYAPAIEIGTLNENSLVTDEDREQYPGVNPANWDDKLHGIISVGQAIEQSYNKAAMWVLRNKVGLKEAQRFGLEFGLHFPEPKDYNSPAALGIGGFREQNGGGTPFGMAQAYTVFANDGVIKPAHTIRKVVLDGKTIVPIKKERVEKRIFSPNTARTMTRLLLGVVLRGTAQSVRLAGNRPVAVKTGTTNNNKEAWIAGYTPDYVTVVMTYSTQTAPDKAKINLVDGNLSKTIFRQIMDNAHRNSSIQNFSSPT